MIRGENSFTGMGRSELIAKIEAFVEERKETAALHEQECERLRELARTAAITVFDVAILTLSELDAANAEALRAKLLEKYPKLFAKP
jgi:hypothetical protein